MARHHAARAYNGLKAGTRLLIDDVGGIDAAASASRVSRSLWSEYASPGSPRFAPVDVILDVEAIGGTPRVTAALARSLGYALTLVEPRDRGAVADQLAQLARTAGDVLSNGYAALADGVLTDAERAELLSGLHDIGRVVQETIALLERPRQ